jgi:hypothetical protein
MGQAAADAGGRGLQLPTRGMGELISAAGQQGKTWIN